jgi:hypothetical protein
MAADRSVQRVTPAVERRPSNAATPQRNGAAVAPSPTRALQQRLGNHGTQLFAAQLVARCSAPGAPGGASGGGTSAGPFSLSHPDDAHEREAARVADAVMRTTERGSTSTSPAAPTVQRVCASCQEETATREPAGQPDVGGGAGHVRRSESSVEASQVSAPVAASIHDMQGGGAPLPGATRAFFEPRFGADFSHVRVHTGGRADATAQAISAKAFTVGSDIVFAGGEYSPESHEGQHLLAHELTHVVQQDAGTRRLNRQADRVDPGIVTATNAPTIQRAWYNFDIPFTDYQFDPSLEGIKTAATVVKDTAAEALQWVVDEIKGLVNDALAWLGDQWESLKGLMRSAFNAAKDAFGNVVSFLLSPFGLLADAITRLDPAALSKSWATISSVVTSVADGFKRMAAGLMKPFEVLWDGINGYATWVLDKLSGLLGNFVFRKLPDFMQRIARDAVNGLKFVWKKISDGWNALYNEIKSWVDGAIDAVAGFVRKVLSFGINVVLTGIIQFGQIVLFLKDLFSDPMKYVAILAKRSVQAFDGVESRFSGLIGQHFGSAKVAAPAETKRSATWSEIGHGIAEMMGKKWGEFKSNPLSIITGLLMDLVLPMVGNVKDIIQLFKDIKKIVTGPLSAGSLEELWTSLLQILDIPILIYHTVVSILMRTLMLPLIVASFVRHPLITAIASAVGYGLLGAFVQAEVLNLAQKLLLLKSGVTNKAQKEEAYNRVADSLIALAMTAVIIVVMIILHFIANVMKGVYNFVKGKLFGIEPTPVEAKGTAPGESKGKAGDADADSNKAKTLEKADLGFENGKRVLAEEPTADGKHKIKVTEDGVCLRCSDCGTLIKEYAIELNEPRNAAILAELEAAETTVNPKLKARKMAAIEEKLAEVRKNNPHPNDPKLARQARIEILAKDPAQGGKATPKTLREAEVAVGMEEAGRLKAPIRRDPTGGADFIAGDGKAWDVKRPESGRPPAQGGFDLATDSAKIDKSLSLGEDVVVDTGNMSASDLASLKAEGVTRGWGDRVQFFP